VWNFKEFMANIRKIAIICSLSITIITSGSFWQFYSSRENHVIDDYVLLCFLSVICLCYMICFFFEFKGWKRCIIGLILLSLMTLGIYNSVPLNSGSELLILLGFFLFYYLCVYICEPDFMRS
jgi:hypothetical protein